MQKSKLQLKIQNLIETIRCQCGFTLIELLVAIAVLGIVAGALFSAINPAKRIGQANDSKRKTDLAQIQKALEQFYQDNNGKYPTNPPTSGDYRIVGFDGPIGWGENWRGYMNVLPSDPNAVKQYVYVTLSNGQSYRLYASLDLGGNDSQACFPSGTECLGATGISCCVGGSKNCGVCNYGVTSPNITP